MTPNTAESATAGVPVVMVRSAQSYRDCQPNAVASGSKAQMMYFVEDAKADIASLLGALDTARAEIERLGKLVGDVHRVLCGTRGAPSHTVGADIEWCIDHCRTVRATLSPAVKEPK